MHIAGFVLSLVLVNAPITPITQHAAPTATPLVPPGPVDSSWISEGIPRRSPDPAPPHPLKPRVQPPVPASGLARIAQALARAVLRDHRR
jgi:hypothetical protein